MDDPATRRYPPRLTRERFTGAHEGSGGVIQEPYPLFPRFPPVRFLIHATNSVQWKNSPSRREFLQFSFSLRFLSFLLFQIFLLEKNVQALVGGEAVPPQQICQMLFSMLSFLKLFGGLVGIDANGANGPININH